MNERVKVIEGEFLENTFDPDLEADFSAFREELSAGEGAEGTISVYKVPIDEKGNVIAKSRKQSFLFAVPVGGVSLIDIINRVKAEFMRDGENFCVVRLIGSRPGHRGNPFNKILYIEKENEAPKAAPSNGQPDVVALMRAMQEGMAAQNSRNEAFMQRMMEMQMSLAQARSAAPAAASGDPLAMFEKLMLMQTMFQRFAPMLGAPAAAAAAVPTDPMAQIIGTMLVMKEMRSIMGDGGGDEGGEESGFLGTLKQLGGPALALLAENEKTKRAILERGGLPSKKRVAVAPKPGAPAQPAQASQPATVESTASEVTQGEDDPMSILAFREQLKALCEMAAEGADAASAATLVLEQIPDEYDDQLGDLVSDENAASFQSKIGTLYAGCKQHAVWFEQLRVAINAAYDDPDVLPS